MANYCLCYVLLSRFKFLLLFNFGDFKHSHTFLTLIIALLHEGVTVTCLVTKSWHCNKIKKEISFIQIQASHTLNIKKKAT